MQIQPEVVLGHPARKSHLLAKSARSSAHISVGPKIVEKPRAGFLRDRFVRGREGDPFRQLDECHSNPHDSFSKSLCALLKPRANAGNPMDEERVLGWPLAFQAKAEAKRRVLLDAVDFSLGIESMEGVQFRQQMAWAKESEHLYCFIGDNLVLFRGPDAWHHSVATVATPISIETAAGSLYYLANCQLCLQLVDGRSDTPIRTVPFGSSYEGASQTLMTAPEDKERALLLLMATGGSLKLFDMQKRHPLVAECKQHWRREPYACVRFVGHHGLAALNGAGQCLLWDRRNMSQPVSDLGRDSVSRITHFDVEPAGRQHLVYSTASLDLCLADVATLSAHHLGSLDAPAVDLAWRHDGVVSAIHSYPQPGLSSWKVDAQKTAVRLESLLEDSMAPWLEVKTAAISKKDKLAATIGNFSFLEPGVANPNLSVLKL